MEITPARLLLVGPNKSGPRLLAQAFATARESSRTLWRVLMTRARRAPKSLLLRETAALGDRRYVAVIQFEGQRYLIGSSPSSVTLLAHLPGAVTVPENSTAAPLTEGTKQ